jgi:GT2 family glycosyltransferase
MINLAIVIINLDRHAHMMACLRTLDACPESADALVVICNHGVPPEHSAALQRAWPDAVQLDLTENLGYAGNNNIGIELALERGADWVLLLNDDTELAPDCLTEMAHAIAASGSDGEHIGMVGPMVYHYDESNVIQSAGGTLDSKWRSIHAGQNEVDRGQFPAPRDVAWVSGCALLARREMIEHIGLLDERFFVYWEETEWCLRAKKAGWRALHVPAARLWHKGVRRDYRPQPYVTYYMTRNRFLMLQLLGGPSAAWRDAWLQPLRTLASYTLKPKWRESKREERVMLWRALRDYLASRWGEMPS